MPIVSPFWTKVPVPLLLPFLESVAFASVLAQIMRPGLMPSRIMVLESYCVDRFALFIPVRCRPVEFMALKYPLLLREE